jgi:hypothetical protein
MRFGINIDYKKRKNILPLRRVAGHNGSKFNRKPLRVFSGKWWLQATKYKNCKESDEEENGVKETKREEQNDVDDEEEEEEEEEEIKVK